jgi:hypothetical protein
MGLGVMIYTPSFIKTGSGIEKLKDGDTQAHKQHSDIISLFLFFQNKDGSLNTGMCVEEN